MSATSINNMHRLQRELVQIQSTDGKLKNVHVDESDITTWFGLILPENSPYSKGAFKIKMVFPKEYPFKPPNITFLTKIYHPNIDEEGAVCLNIVNPEMWKPATRVINIVDALVKLVEEPEPDHPLRPELAQLFLKDRKRFLKNAEEFTRKNSEKRS